LEILIDVTGRVAGVRVLRSISSLDDAAVRTVREWRFEPAVRHGRPVPVLAWTPVRFAIY
jgi:protein TonB